MKFLQRSHLLSAKPARITSTSEMRNSLRLPINFTVSTHVIVPTMPVTPSATVAQFGLIGVPYVFKMRTMYGLIACIPENWAMKKTMSSTTNGFSVRFRISSCNFCMALGGGCVHFRSALTHSAHAFEYSLYRTISANSFSTAFGDTHPRSHCNDFRASSWRPFDSNHSGVSGILLKREQLTLNTNRFEGNIDCTYEANSKHRYDWNDKAIDGGISPCGDTAQKKHNEKSQGCRNARHSY